MRATFELTNNFLSNEKFNHLILSFLSPNFTCIRSKFEKL